MKTEIDLNDPRQLAAAVAHQIRTNPESHNQTSYTSTPTPTCKTTACVAGWAGHLSPQVAFLCIRPDGFSARAVGVDGREDYLSTIARELLGVGWRTGIALFDGDSSRDYVLKMLDAIVEHGPNSGEVQKLVKDWGGLSPDHSDCEYL